MSNIYPSVMDMFNIGYQTAPSASPAHMIRGVLAQHDKLSQQAGGEYFRSQTPGARAGVEKTQAQIPLIGAQTQQAQSGARLQNIIANNMEGGSGGEVTMTDAQGNPVKYMVTPTKSGMKHTKVEASGGGATGAYNKALDKSVGATGVWARSKKHVEPGSEKWDTYLTGQMKDRLGIEAPISDLSSPGGLGIAPTADARTMRTKLMMAKHGIGQGYGQQGGPMGNFQQPQQPTAYAQPQPQAQPGQIQGQAAPAPVQFNSLDEAMRSDLPDGTPVTVMVNGKLQRFTLGPASQ